MGGVPQIGFAANCPFAMKPLSLSLRVLAPIVFAFLTASPLQAQEPLQAPEPLQAQVPVEEPILERYTLGVGVHSDGVAAVLSDRFFGGGTAQAVLAYLDTAPRKNLIDLSGSLVINVSRRVRTGEVTLGAALHGRAGARGPRRRRLGDVRRRPPAFTLATAGRPLHAGLAQDFAVRVHGGGDVLRELRVAAPVALRRRLSLVNLPRRVLPAGCRSSRGARWRRRRSGLP